jgi:hypothetical protein
MKYMLITYESHGDFEARNDVKRQEQYWAAWKEYEDTLIEAGVTINMYALQPRHTSMTVRLRDEGLEVQEGPYVNTKEQLGGIYIIEVPDSEHALKWASSCPAAVNGVVEIRPLLTRG